MPTVEALRMEAFRALIPPPRLRLSEWIEEHVQLPAGVSAQPGPVQLWPFQREIADAIGDPLIERVTLVKPVRVGFTTLLTSAVASFVANEPSPILCLLPTQDDCRDYVVSDIEPIFSETEIVARSLSDDTAGEDRNTLFSRRFAGGSLKVVAAKSPRNLRRHNVRVLFIDEADGMETTQEGSPIMLAERRTLSFPDRKIVLGSTPVHEDTSHVIRAYARSDGRVFEVPCPGCGSMTVIEWSHIVWPEGQPSEACWKCPHCEDHFAESHKGAMVAQGGWRATRPEIKGHAGFHLNALVSLHANAAWGKLAEEFVGVKDDPTTLQTFVNTILGQGWKGAGEELSESELAAQAKDFGLGQIPAEVLAISVGCDVQHDRLEVTYLGHSEDGAIWVLGHRVIWGQWNEDVVWQDLDTLLKEKFPHELGGAVGVSSAAIDAGDGTTMTKVVDFCRARTSRRVVAIKGVSGSRALIQKSQSATKTGGRFFLVGVDTAKTQLFARMSQGRSIRYSEDLEAVWYEQATSERAVVRYNKGQPVRRFERVPGKRAEALDCLVYAFAAGSLLTPNWGQLRHDLARPAAAVEAERRAKKKPKRIGYLAR